MSAIRKPQELFVRCSWHEPKNSIVRRRDGKVTTGRLREMLDRLLPMTHGMCAVCSNKEENK